MCIFFIKSEDPKSAKIKLRISEKGLFLIDFSIVGNIFGCDHQNVPLITVVVKLNWWHIDHNCYVHNEPHICLVMWNVFGECMCLKLRLV